FELKVAIPKNIFINEGKKTIKDIIDYVESEGLIYIIVGYPLNLNKALSKNEMMVEVDKFVGNLKKEVNKRNLSKKVDIEICDECLSTFEAQAKMREIHDNTGQRTQIVEDAIAAQIILERFFDSLDS
ncbi:RuvX/YqgF family protein, partial [Patescibacteria group bacterium]